MNEKTAKLLNKWAFKNKTSSREAKRTWNEANSRARAKIRKKMKKELMK